MYGSVQGEVLSCYYAFNLNGNVFPDALVIPSRRDLLKDRMEIAKSAAASTDTETPPQSSDQNLTGEGVESFTFGLIAQLMKVLRLYEDVFSLISSEDKQADAMMRNYAEVFSATKRDRIADIHSNLIRDAFAGREHEFIGMPHRLKQRLGELELKDIELGSNLLDEAGNPKKRGVFLPLGPIWRMSVKLRERAKELLKMGSSKITKTDLMNTGMHHILYLVVMHLEDRMGDAKAIRTCKNYANFIHRIRILGMEEGDGRPSFAEAINKVRGLMSGPMLQQIISGAGVDLEAEEVEKITSRMFGSDGEDGGIEDIFNQISSGEMTPDGISSMVSKLTNVRPDEKEEKDDDDEDDIGIDEYDEYTRYEDDEDELD